MHCRMSGYTDTVQMLVVDFQVRVEYGDNFGMGTVHESCDVSSDGPVAFSRG